MWKVLKCAVAYHDSVWLSWGVVDSSYLKIRVLTNFAVIQLLWNCLDWSVQRPSWHWWGIQWDCIICTGLIAMEHILCYQFCKHLFLKHYRLLVITISYLLSEKTTYSFISSVIMVYCKCGLFNSSAISYSI